MQLLIKRVLVLSFIAVTVATVQAGNDILGEIQLEGCNEGREDFRSLGRWPVPWLLKGTQRIEVKMVKDLRFKMPPVTAEIKLSVNPSSQPNGWGTVVVARLPVDGRSRNFTA